MVCEGCPALILMRKITGCPEVDSQPQEKVTSMPPAASKLYPVYVTSYLFDTSAYCFAAACIWFGGVFDDGHPINNKAIPRRIRDFMVLYTLRAPFVLWFGTSFPFLKF